MRYEKTREKGKAGFVYLFLAPGGGKREEREKGRE